jgi:hypothetical protein
VGGVRRDSLRRRSVTFWENVKSHAISPRQASIEPATEAGFRAWLAVEEKVPSPGATRASASYVARNHSRRYSAPE